MPSGVWDASEYEKLPRYDLATGDQPAAAFFCHQADGHICAGWAGCHDTSELLALRLPFHGLSPEELERTFNYQSPIPLFASGQEAMDHGMRDINNPSEPANRMRRRLLFKLRDKGVT